MSKGSPFKPDYRIAILSIIGITGLLVGCVILFYHDIYTISTTDSIFHEVEHNPIQVVTAQLNKTIDSLTLDKRKNAAEYKRISGLKAIKFDPKLDSLVQLKTSLQQRNNIDSINIRILQGYQVYCSRSSIADSIRLRKLTTPLHILINRNSILSWDDQYKHGDTTFVADFIFKDTAMSFAIQGKDTFRIKNAPSDINFIAKYPAAGVWLLSILIFCSFCAFAITTCIFLNNRVMDIFEDKGLERKKITYFIITCIIFLVLLGLNYSWKYTFNDEEISRELYFIKNWGTSTTILTFIGYSCGSFCLAGFVSSASMLSFFAQDIKKTSDVIYQKKQGSTESNAIPETLKDISAEEMEKIKAEREEIYKKLSGFFNIYFVLSGIILTLQVLCTGGLYTMINSLSFVKLIAAELGYSPTRPDFIYLYGGIHTLILLLVYIPAKMRFNEIIIAHETAPVGNENDPNFKNFFNEPLSQVKQLLITVSPLMAGLLQALFDMLIK